MPSAYLDHAATTPMRPEAVAAMLAFLTDRFGNPSGSHSLARSARLALDEARDVMAEALGAAPGQVVFTSGGTEADNLAIGGVHAARGGVVVCPAAEHHAVLHAVAAAGGTVVGVGRDGSVDLGELAEALGPQTTLVSVMLANNEVGVVSPLGEVIALVRERAPEALVHTDAVQGFSWLDVARLAADADLVSVSAHKFGGPKGVGALVVRDRVALRPILHGGGQERDRRSGTPNVAGIVSMAAAAQATLATRPETVSRVSALRDRLTDGLLEAVPDVVATGADSGSVGAPRVGAPSVGTPRVGAPRVAGSCHLRFTGVEAEALLVLLDDAGVCASAGSACSSGATEASHVLRAMGWTTAEVGSSVRLSLGWCSTAAEVDHALAVIPKAVARLRDAVFSLG
ncbi:MAG: cysteine desulfurase family protein [Acidimicrobiales bacterium]